MVGDPILHVPARVAEHAAQLAQHAEAPAGAGATHEPGVLLAVAVRIVERGSARELEQFIFGLRLLHAERGQPVDANEEAPVVLKDRVLDDADHLVVIDGRPLGIGLGDVLARLRQIMQQPGDLHHLRLVEQGQCGVLAAGTGQVEEIGRISRCEAHRDRVGKLAAGNVGERDVGVELLVEIVGNRIVRHRRHGVAVGHHLEVVALAQVVVGVRLGVHGPRNRRKTVGKVVVEIDRAQLDSARASAFFLAAGECRRGKRNSHQGYH